jgi:hypothetical protein
VSSLPERRAFTLASSSESRSDILGSSSTGKSGIAISSGRNSGTFAEGIAIVQCAMRNKMHCAEADSCRYGRHP